MHFSRSSSLDGTRCIVRKMCLFGLIFIRTCSHNDIDIALNSIAALIAETANMLGLNMLEAA